jgi:hypothetical protein
LTEGSDTMTEDRSDPERRPSELEADVRVVRAGHGANCSSIGSVIDTLFITALAGGAIFAAVVAALGHESIRVVGDPTSGGPQAKPEGERAPEDTP